MNQVQSIRGVGSKKGYSYYAWGVYEAVPRARDGVLVYKLVRSSKWFRSDKTGRYAFPGIPMVEGVRHGSPVPNRLSETCVAS